MPRKLTEYTLLFSCPGDAYKECHAVIQSAVDDFNMYAKSSLSISLELIHWFADSYPQSGGHPQALLNSQIVDNADAAIAIFWTRFGTPTDEYDSGTEEEIELLINSNKQVFLYFLDKAVPPSMTDSYEYQEQRRKIALYRKKYENNKGIYRVVADENELKEQFSQHLFLYFARRIAEDTGIPTKNAISKLTITAVDGSNQAQVKHLNLSVEIGLDERRNHIVDKIQAVQAIILPHVSQVKNSENREHSLVLSEATSKVFANMFHSINFVESPSSEEAAVISDEEMNLVTEFCTTNGIEIADDFWFLDGLQTQYSKLSIMGVGQGESLIGSEEAKQKYNLLRKIICDIYKYVDSNNFYSKMDGIPFVELIARNEGTSFDEDIEINLLLPQDSLMKADDFPMLLFELEEIVENDHIDCWFCPEVTANIEPFDYSPSTGVMPYIPAMLPFQQRGYEAEFVQKKEEYYDRIKELFDWDVFVQGATEIVKIRIGKLNQFRSMHLPSRLFFKTVPDKISYSIKAKYSPNVIKGEIDISLACRTQGAPT